MAHQGRVTKLGQGSAYRSQSRVLVKRLRDYFEKEKQNGGPLLPVRQVTERVSKALGVGKRFISQVSKEEVSVTPGKKRCRRRPVSELDDFSKCAVRNVIYELYRTKVLPTRKRILGVLKEREIFVGGHTSLSKVLHELGFKWKNVNNRKFLMERSDIVGMRCDFLQEISKININDVVFLDETWINAGHVKKQSWTDESKFSCRKEPTGKGGRIIVIHAGTSEGFVKNALYVFRSKKEGDYHREMNSVAFKEWFQVLLQNLKPNSIIVMDNAPYHSVQSNKAPTQTSLKRHIMEWLKTNNIPFGENLRKDQLLQIVKAKKPKKSYELDELAANKGHRVIRLPPYHCQFNAIELIWANVKGKVADRNKLFTVTEVERLLVEAVNEITPEDWRKAVGHTKKVIDEAFKTEGLTETAIESLIITVNDESNASMSDSSSDDDRIDNSTDSETESEQEQAGTSDMHGVYRLQSSEESDA
jgi:transposase